MKTLSQNPYTSKVQYSYSIDITATFHSIDDHNTILKIASPNEITKTFQ